MATDATRSSKAARALPLPFGQKLGYAAGALVDGTALHPLNVFLLFYVTVVCGVPAAAAGLAISIGLVVDAVVDPLIGSLTDNHRSRLGRRLPYMLVGTPLVALFFIMLFSLPQGWGQGALFVWLVVAHTGLRVSVSIFALPHVALAAELSDNYSERGSIVTWRWLFYMIGGIASAYVGFALFFDGPEGLANRAGYTPYAVTLAVIMLAGGVVASRTASLTRGREHGASRGEAAKFRVFRDIADAFRNRTFRILFVFTLLYFIGFGLNAVLVLHANTYFWRMTSDQTKMVTLAAYFGLLLGAPLAGPLLSRFEKRNVAVVALIGVLLIEGAPVLLRLAGLFPFQGATLAGIMTAIYLAYGAMLGTAAVATLAMAPDAVDEHELLFGDRREGIFGAANAFANKAASGVGTLLAGFALQIIGFPSSAAKAHVAVQIPQETANLLGIVYGPVSALISLLSVVVLLGYRIDRQTHQQIIAALRERRA
jgi:GPH family glycoside/pentoside/hexuronide:cation symporter